MKVTETIVATGVVAALMGSAMSVPARADGAAVPAATTVSKTESGPNYMGDHLQWNVPIHVYPAGPSGEVDLNTPLCLPAKVKVTGLSSTFTTVSSGNGAWAKSYVPVRLDSKGPVGVKRQDAGPLARMCGDASQAKVLTGSDLEAAKNDTANQVVIDNSTQIFVDSQDADRAALRRGWDYGALIVPFKFQMSGKSSVTWSTTLGGYVGYRDGLDLGDIRLSPIGFIGLSVISVPNAGGSGGKKTSDSVAGFSYGGGLMSTIKDNFNISLVFGADHAGGRNYRYQDKAWVGLALGYSVAN